MRIYLRLFEDGTIYTDTRQREDNRLVEMSITITPGAGFFGVTYDELRHAAEEQGYIDVGGE